MDNKFALVLRYVAFCIALLAGLISCVGGNFGNHLVQSGDLPKKRTISVAAAKVQEGNVDSSYLVFTLTLNRSAHHSILVHYETSDITASGESDYKPVIGNVMVFPGNKTAEVKIAVNGDTEREFDETILLTISQPVGVVIGNSSAIGTIINDDSGYGSCEECPSSVNGLIGNDALLFDGINDRVIYETDVSFDWTKEADFSLELWINTDKCSTTQAILGRYDASNGVEWWIGCSDGHAVFKLVDDEGNGVDSYLSSATTIADGKWHHIYAERESVGNILRLYVDGKMEIIKQATVFTGNFDSSAEISIGLVAGIPAVGPFKGKVDEVSVKNNRLSPNSVKQHLNDGVFGLHRGYVTCNKSKVRIMPVGDSITKGSGGSSTGGYRRLLAQLMNEAGYQYDFVGSKRDSQVLFDPDYQGQSGYTISDIKKNLKAWLVANPADIILLHIGSNGPLDSAGVANLIDKIHSFNANIVFVVARIINTKIPNEAISVFNNEVATQVASRIAKGYRMMLVNHEVALSPIDMKDYKHPVDAGYDKMANVWFDGLRKFLPLCVQEMPSTKAISNLQSN